MPRTYDAATRHLLEAYPDAWPTYLGLAAGGPVRVVDSDLSTVSAEVDKVLRVDAAEPWLLHVELQSGRDLALPARLLRYNVLLDYHHGLPVRSVVVLLRPEADGPDLAGLVRRQLPGAAEPHHEFRYQVVRAWQQPVGPILDGPLGTLPLAPLADVPRVELPAVIGRMEERIGAEATPDEQGTLWSATYLLMGLRYPLEFAARLIQGVRGMKESVTYQAILQEGEARGIAIGEARAEPRWRAEEARRFLLRIGGHKFGQPPREIEATIRSLDAETLEALGDRLLVVTSWEELLAPA